MAVGEVRGSVTMGGRLVVPPNPNEMPPTAVTRLARNLSTANDEKAKQTNLTVKQRPHIYAGAVLSPFTYEQSIVVTTR